MLSNRGERITSLTRGLVPLCVPVLLWRCSILKNPTWARRACWCSPRSACSSRPARASFISSRFWRFGAASPSLAVIASPYKRARILAFLDPWKDPQNTGFHIVQSLLALGSGGIFGMGLGASRAKFFYLPEAHTDFIFAVLGEELGLLGTFVVVALFVAFAYRAVRIALAAPDRFGFFLQSVAAR